MCGINSAVSGSPIYLGVPECGGRLLEPSSTGPQFRVDPGSGVGRRVGSEVAGDCRSLRHSTQLLTPSLFLSPLRSHGSGHRCLFSGVGWPPGVRLSTFCADSLSLEQAGLVQGYISHPHPSILASEGVVSRAPEFHGGSSGAPDYTSRLTQTAPLFFLNFFFFFLPKIGLALKGLMFLCTEKHLSVSAIKGYRSTLISVFKIRLPGAPQQFHPQGSHTLF